VPAAAVAPAAGKSDADGEAPELTSAGLRSRLWALQKEDWRWLSLGIIGSLASGCVQPLTSIVYGNIISIYYLPSGLATAALPYLGWFILLGSGAFVGVLSRISIFTMLGERLTRKLRAQAFEAILRQPAAFFDEPRNGVGRLTTRLATDAALVKGASGEALGSLVEGTGAIICALAISFSASWRLALVLLCVFPFLIIGTSTSSPCFAAP
jgi:ABC-type multidrug transport system fused ATPase/permease subunit